jgi:hypothetical protein
VLNSSEEAHVKSMSIFEIDEHLQGEGYRLLSSTEADRSTMRPSSRALSKCADAQLCENFVDGLLRLGHCFFFSPG